MVYRYFNKQLNCVVAIKSRSNATRITYKYENDEFVIKTPVGYEKKFCPFIEEALVERMLQYKEKCERIQKENNEIRKTENHIFEIGKPIVTPRFSVEVRVDNQIREHYFHTNVDVDNNILYIEVNEQTQIDSESAQSIIRSMVRDFLSKFLKIEFIHELITLSEKYSVDYDNIRYGKATRTLGTCSSSGIITLSGMMCFLPDHLFEYIFAHEVAHLEEMNHSSKFYAILERNFPNRNELDEEVKQCLDKYFWMVWK